MIVDCEAVAVVHLFAERAVPRQDAGVEGLIGIWITTVSPVDVHPLPREISVL